MADTSTDAVAPASVWVQLYWDNNEKSGEPFEIEPIPKNVGDLKKAVKEGFTTELQHCGAARLKVYAPDTTVPIPNGTESLDPGDSVSFTTTSKAHLIVIAPKPQEQQNGELRCCFCILVFKCCYEYETNSIYYVYI